jgi:hypothetical protein
LADEFECKEIFFTKHTAQKHAGVAHLKPFICPRPGCHKRFAAEELAAQHAEEVDLHPPEGFFICPVSTCRFAMKRQPLSMHLKDTHMMRHRKQGKLMGNETLQPVMPHASSHCDLYHLITRDSQLKGNENDDGDGDGSKGLWSVEFGADDDGVDKLVPSITDNVSLISTITRQPEEAERCFYGAELLSEESRPRILARNTKYWGMYFEHRLNAYLLSKEI